MSFVNALVVAIAWLATMNDPRTLLIKAEIARLQGAWQVVELTVDGTKAPSEEDAFMECVFRGQRLSVKGEHFNDEALFQLDPSPALKTIDLANPDRPGPMTSGIYQLRGDDLILCFASEGPNRPTDFTNEKGSHRTTFVLRRVNVAKRNAELAKLQGDWRLVSASSGGRTASEDQVALGKLIVRDNRFEIRRASELAVQGTFATDLTGKKPRLRVVAKDAESEPAQFIADYECEGATLRVTLELPSGAKAEAVFQKEPAASP